MGFHLIDQAACFAVGQPTVRVCTVPNGRSTQGGKFWTWLGLCCHGGNVFLGGLHGLPPTSGRSMDCSAAIASAVRLPDLAGHSRAAAQAVECLPACAVQSGRGSCGPWRAEIGMQHQKAGRGPGGEKRCSWFRAPLRDLKPPA